MIPECELDYVDIDMLKSSLKVLNRNTWLVNALNKTKLETFLEVVDRDKQLALVKSTLSRSQRSLVMKVECGILTLVETGRFKNTPREKCLCQICTKKVIETESHFLYEYPAIKPQRDELYKDFAELGDVKELNKWQVM